jgi:plasmid rolling circle replication initiator protein Rep
LFLTDLPHRQQNTLGVESSLTTEKTKPKAMPRPVRTVRSAIITEVPSKENSTELFLTEVSVKDKPWDIHRSEASKVRDFYVDSESEKYADRMTVCSLILGFGLTFSDVDTLKLKLKTAWFCKVRTCPICQWRKSLAWKAKGYQIMPKIVEKYPNYRYIFLTLTQRNIPITELRSNLQALAYGFKKLALMADWPGQGYLRSVEVTRGEDGSAHPHQHVLLIVKPSYFSTGYIKQSEWVLMWQKAMKLDYDPSVNVKAIKRETNPIELIPEILKYCLKPADMLADRDWFLEYTKQIARMRTVTTAGIFKDYFRELENDHNLDLIGKDGENDEELARLIFGWKQALGKYQLID